MNQSMFGTSQHTHFDWTGFSAPMDYTVTGVSEWVDWETKKPLGHRVDTVVTRDDTQYRTKDGKTVSNLYKRQSFKCFEKPDVKIGDIVEPVEPVATLYGKFHNEISVKCKTMRVVTPAAGKDKG